MKDICKQIKEWKVRRLYLSNIRIEIGYNHNQHILKQIASIQFPYLTEIYFYENELESIEVFHTIDLPSLMSLNFGNTFIT